MRVCRFPLVMNIMQFWVIDTFIKHKTENPNQIIRLNRDEEQDAEALLANDDEPTDPPPRYSIDDGDDDDEASFVSVHHPSELFSSSSTEASPSIRTNEYELKSKKH